MSFTPSVTINQYKKNGSPTAIPETTTVTSGTLTGYGERYIYNIIVDPMELSSTTIDTHELIFNMAKNSGNENIYVTPVVSGYATGNKFRMLNATSGAFDMNTWNVGSPTGSVIVDIDDIYAGSAQAISVPNLGSAWSPPFGSSGTKVVDVPTIFMGSYTAIVQPTDWDSDFNNYLHDMQMVQVHVGHAVQVRNTDFTTGYQYNNEINLSGTTDFDYYMEFKTYHEFAEEWEWFSGATKVESGTQTHVDDIWQVITVAQNLTFSAKGTYNFYLKLYGNGNITHPTPLRVVNINLFISVSDSGRFGIERFGIGRFGKD